MIIVNKRTIFGEPSSMSLISSGTPPASCTASRPASSAATAASACNSSGMLALQQAIPVSMLTAARFVACTRSCC